MSISMDAREILCHLNKMGYKSITAEQLKEFMRGFLILFFFLTQLFSQTKFFLHRFKKANKIRQNKPRLKLFR